jgi:lipopolysaccharide export system permease protein
MRTSDLYIGKQVLLGTLYAVVILGVVLVLGNLFSKVQPLLVESKAPLGLVLRFVINVLPVSLMYTVPWGFLSAVMLVFGRLSNHQEITAFRVAGMSLVRVAAPVFVIGLLLSGLSLWLNTHVVPNSKAEVTQLIYEQAVRDPASLLKPGVVQGNFNKGDKDVEVKVLIESKGDGWVEGFNLYQFSNGDSGGFSYLHAKRARLFPDVESSQLRLKLEDARFETRNKEGAVESPSADKVEPLLLSFDDPKRNKKVKAGAMTNDEILEAIAHDPKLDDEKKVKFRSEITKRWSFSMASIAFAFIAVPLSLGTRRRDTSSGLVYSLLIGTGYFVFTLVAEHIKTDAGATAILWAPNAACVLLGIFLFRRARFR